jgi:hypothetical protein
MLRSPSLASSQTTSPTRFTALCACGRPCTVAARRWKSARHRDRR